MTNSGAEGGFRRQKEANLPHLFDRSHPAVQLGVVAGLNHLGRVVTLVPIL